jgi:hypothetical protein
MHYDGKYYSRDIFFAIVAFAAYKAIKSLRSNTCPAVHAGAPTRSAGASGVKECHAAYNEI